MDDERLHREVERFWAEIAAGGPAPPGDLDPALAETIARVQQGSAVPPPDLGWMKQLREEIMDAQTGLVSPGNWLFVANGHVNAPVRSGVLSLPVRQPGRIEKAFTLAAAAVLLLALAGGLLSIRFGQRGSDEGSFGSIPAVQVSPAASPPTSPVQFLWETHGDPADPPWNASHLAVAPDGTIWVADGNNHRFQIFSPDGSLLEVWGTRGSAEGQFDFTTLDWGGYRHGAITFAPDGSFYVADIGNHRIQKFAPDRSFLLEWGGEGSEPGQFGTPIDLVVDAQGRVYVVDSDRSDPPADAETGAVQVFDADGRFLLQWGPYGVEPGDINDPFGIGLDADGTLLVAEATGHRVQRFTPDGELLDGWGGFGIKDGKFANAMDTAVDEQGRVFVADFSNSRVQVFDRDGRFLAAWGTFGREAGEFHGPVSVAVGGDGTVYVTDDRRLQAFRVGALPVAQVDTAAADEAAQVPPEATPPASPVQFLWETRGDPNSPMENALYLAIAPDGNIWVPDGQNGRFQIFSPDGALLEMWGSKGTGPGQFDFVHAGFGGFGQGGIAFDDEGNFYVADTGNDRIQKFGPDREFLTSWGGTGREDGQFLGVTDLAVDSQGRVYTVDADRSDFPADPDVGSVQVFDRDGRFLTDWGFEGKEPGQLSNPLGIAIDLDGNVIVTEFDNNRLQRFTPDGAFIDGWGSFGIREGQFVHPNDAVVDEHGNIFVTDWSNSRVQVFDHDGQFLTTWGDYGLDPGQFSGASSLVLDGMGNIYVTDDAGRLQKFRILTLPEPAATPTA